ncbi:nucleotidyltransferase domain-containing protein [Candidatus Woesearchaeota archaeon]|nr:nucleotidyltransferase domain-containing protein [Candidatus Woesearchaeota archaeon]
MYKIVNKQKLTELHLEVLSLFTKGFDKQYYIREINRLLKISPRTSQISLDFLEKKLILESSSKGKIKLYKIKKSFIAKDYLVVAEIYKKIKLMENNAFIKDIIEKIYFHINYIGLIFGSYANNTQNKDSDLDLFIIGEYNPEKIREISNVYNIKINVKNYNLKIFKNSIKDDILINEVVNNHIIIKGFDDFISFCIK